MDVRGVFSNRRATSRFGRAFRKPRVAQLAWIATVSLTISLAWIFNNFRGGSLSVPVAPWIELAVDWLVDNMGVVFDSMKKPIAFVLITIERVLLWLPWWAGVALVVLFGWRLAGARVAILCGVGMFLIQVLGLWELSMATLALAITAVLICNAVGIPLGVLAARSDRVEAAVRPILDFMQTMPAFVYLIPAIMFFGIGKVPGVMACVIYGLPPAVRLTNLGIRQVPSELVEVAHAFGSTRRQLLFKVQLPLALPSIMAGVNQTLMLSLGMVVLAAMIAAGGLGREVLFALGQVDIGRGFVAGTCIVVLAMVLDRITQSLGHGYKRSSSGASGSSDDARRRSVAN